MNRRAIAYCVALLLLGILAGAIGSAGLFDRGGNDAAFVTAPVGARPAAFPGMEIDYVGSGKFHVPDQAPPGEYAVTSTSGTFGCSWWVLKADDSKPKSEITAGTFNRAGFDTFVIPVSARWLKLMGRCTLTRAEDSP